MLEIQKFLLDRNPNIAVHQQDRAKLSVLGSTLEGHSLFLKINRHSKFSNLVQFSYNQILSQKDHPIVREARGLILDQNNDWKIVAYPFKRFFNFGEPCADAIDWNTAEVFEKVDGSLIIMYWYADRWRVATSGTPDASGLVGDHMFWEKGTKIPMTFEKLFWSSCEFWLKGLSRTGDFDKNCTYIWELTSPWNRVICNYQSNKEIGYGADGSKITLLGVRNNTTLQELPLEPFVGDVYFTAKSFPFRNQIDVIAAASKLNPFTQEGFVVIDERFNRVKIKSPAYVTISHLKDGSTRRRLIDLIKAGEDSEVLSYNLLDEFPEEKKMFEGFRSIIETKILHAEDLYARIKDVQNRKEFASQALTTTFWGALFALRDDKVKSIRESVMGIASDRLLDIVDVELSKVK